MYEPYIRLKGTENQCIQYANRIIKTDDPDRDLETLNCYHDIKCGNKGLHLMTLPLNKVEEINKWMKDVEYAFGLSSYTK